ncbi:hypothetical protein SASPL_148946 [Salvia splendens]|uniref:Uncharacterized protein n=1 Tax=Salvia splendens TaxID=180675 RepID=A0A8X8WAA0_SALSN|nr:hypothetical protein SASPL_148946 [Salvia splendens]
MVSLSLRLMHHCSIRPTSPRNKLGVCPLSSLELRGSVNIAIKQLDSQADGVNGIHDIAMNKVKILECKNGMPPVHNTNPSWKDILVGKLLYKLLGPPTRVFLIPLAILGYFSLSFIDILRICMKEQPRSKWEELLEICIIKVQENMKVTNQRLLNLERNTGLLEQGLASLTAQVRELEFNMGVLATTIGSKHTPGMLPSLPKINIKGNCHAVQLRSGTTYQPPQATDLGRGRKEKE